MNVEMEDMKTCQNGAREVESSEVDNDMVHSVHAVGDFVAAMYDGLWYIGKILEVDIDDKE